MQTLLIVGAGDIARRLLPSLSERYRLVVLIRNPSEAASWRQRGVRPLLADLDDPPGLRRLAGVADIVLHFAPPPSQGETDPRTRRLLAALGRGQSRPRRAIYLSTSGVYGNCAGRRVSESTPISPATARARRRADAERQWRCFARRHALHLHILRVPGIYATDRLPLERLRQANPVLRTEDDVFSSHIHADDLARLVAAALRRGRSNRCYNAADDSELKMGDYFDLVADHLGQPRPARLPRAEISAYLTPVQLSFMSESRRLDNRRIKQELRFRLRYPRVADGIGFPSPAASRTDTHAAPTVTS